MKACGVCGESKPLADYHKDSGAKDVHTWRCKACVSSAAKTWREQNAEHRKAQRKAYYEANKAQILAAQKSYNEANAAKRNITRAAWDKANADKVKSYKREWRAANAQRLKEQKRKQYQANATEWKARNAAWRKEHQEQVSAYRRQLVEEVGPSYAAGLLGMQTAKTPPVLLQMKRDEIALRRLARTLKKASNENQQNG